MIFDDALNDIIENVSKITTSVNKEDVNKMIEMIEGVENVFIMGLGRSGLVAKAFGMRLMHLGLNVYIVGETITPAIKKKIV